MTHRAFSLLLAGLAILLLGALAMLVVEQTELSASLTSFLFPSVQLSDARPLPEETKGAACAVLFRQCTHNCLRSVFGEEGNDRCIALCSPTQERCQREAARSSPTPSGAPGS